MSAEVWAAIGSALGLNGLVLFFVQRRVERRDREARRREDEREQRLAHWDVSMETLRLLAYWRLSDELERLLEQGFATAAERHFVDEMFENYKQHGWNGDMDQRLQRVYALPGERGG